ncbi:ATPase [Aureococcus anophagefferens]|nr:ATPase [Aureococcus anophagefferens]
MDCEVVVLQWQSRSRKLTWAFEAADDGSSLFRPSSLSPPASPLEEEDDDDDSSADGGEAPAAPPPPPAADSGGTTPPRARGLGAADAVAGADRALGPLRDDPPDDAASHAPRGNRGRGGLRRPRGAVRRVFGDDGAPHFVF